MSTQVIERETVPLLHVEGAGRTFGSFRAVSDVSFDVAPHEILGIAGPNGAGKSTLFNLISGVPFGPSSGEVWFAGQQIDTLAGYRIGRLGLRRTFQADQVFPELTVQQNVALAARYLNGRGSIGAAADVALERTGITAYAKSVAGDAPVLIKKKIMIASGLVGDPQLLMLDEPAGGLDTDDQADLAHLIESLNREGLTLVIIEHVLSLLRRVAGRMIVMVAGEVLVTGTPEQVLADPRVIEAYLGESTS